MKFFFLFLFCFCCLLVIIIIIFNNSISSSICKLPIRSEIYNCTFKNTNKVSITKDGASVIAPTLSGVEAESFES